MPGHGKWRTRLRGQGCRWTAPREAVLRCLGRSGRHLSPKEIFSEIMPESPGVGLTTVYRTLELLDRMNLLHKIRIGDGQIRYGLKREGGNDHHHHLICTRCGTIIDYTDFLDEEVELIRKTEAALTRRHGFEIRDHKIEFYGLCRSCRQKTNGPKNDVREKTNKEI